jgi:hypothetical protein
MDVGVVLCWGGICGGASSSRAVRWRRGRLYCGRSNPDGCHRLASCLGSPKMIPKRNLVSEHACPTEMIVERFSHDFRSMISPLDARLSFTCAAVLATWSASAKIRASLLEFFKSSSSLNVGKPPAKCHRDDQKYRDHTGMPESLSNGRMLHGLMLHGLTVKLAFYSHDCSVSEQNCSL